MYISVAICTWNRAELLDSTLFEFRRLCIPVGLNWELLVVNNNSTDDTDKVLKKHQSHLPLRCFFESKQGLSHARNVIFNEAKSDFIIWTDDDVQVDSHWLNNYAKAAVEWPDAAFFGGTIDPWFECKPPNWVLDNISSLYGPFVILSFGEDTRRLVGYEFPFGANMAVRRSALQGLTFDPRLGRNGTDLLGGEETDLFVKLLEAEKYGVWIGSAKVRHFIPSRRMTRKFVWNWYHANARTHVRRGVYRHSEGPQLFGAPRWAWRRMITQRLRALVHAPFQSKKWFMARMNAAIAHGIICEARALS